MPLGTIAELAAPKRSFERVREGLMIMETASLKHHYQYTSDKGT